MAQPSPIFPSRSSNQPSSMNDALFLGLYSHFIQTHLANERTDLGSDKRFSKLDVQKPQHSYIGLIAKAILSTPDKRMLLNQIYDWIIDQYPYFKYKNSGWRNSVRHNLSLNECFIKDTRAPNGKGHYWTIHPANFLDFSQGDFRRWGNDVKLELRHRMYTGFWIKWDQPKNPKMISALKHC